MRLIEVYRDSVDAYDAIRHVKNQVLDMLIDSGISWEEIAFINTVDAIKFCRETENVTLSEAREMVNGFLRNNS